MKQLYLLVIFLFLSYNHLCGQEKTQTTTAVADMVKTQKSATTLPASFDLRDYKGLDGVAWVGPARDQIAGGPCVAFAVMGAIESYWRKNGMGEPDFSERNMYNWVLKDSEEKGIGIAKDKCMLYFLNWLGPVSESDDPLYYPSHVTAEFNEESRWFTYKEGLTPIARIDQSRCISGASSDVIKRTIIDNGAITASYMEDNIYAYNSSDYTYYFCDSIRQYWPVNDEGVHENKSASGHAVIIVGWDDNKEVTGGRVKPKNKGAWIVRNNWGTDFGEDGFFYMSYDDTSLSDDFWYFPSAEKYDPNLIMYGPEECTSSLQKLGEFFVRYTAKNNETIEKVNVFSEWNNNKINISFYSDFDGTDLSGWLGSTGFKTCEWKGYYTFDVSDVNISVKKGNNFYVKVTSDNHTYTDLSTWQSSSCAARIMTQNTPGLADEMASPMELGKTYTGNVYIPTLFGGGVFTRYSGCTGESYSGIEKYYSFTPPCSGVYEFSSIEKQGNPDFFLMSKLDNTSTNLVGGCWYDSCTKQVYLDAGKTVYLIVDTNSSGSSNEYSVSVNIKTPDSTPMALDEPYSGTVFCDNGVWDKYTDCEKNEPGGEAFYSFTARMMPGKYSFTGSALSGQPDFFLMSDLNNASTNLTGGCWNNEVNEVHLDAGQTVYLIVDNSRIEEHAQYSVHVQLESSDIVITEMNLYPYYYTGDVSGAGGIFDRYTGCTKEQPGNEAFYSFTPPCPGVYTFSATETSGDPDFFVMSGIENTSVNLSGGCWDNGNLEVKLDGGHTVYLLVDNPGTDMAGYKVSVNLKNRQVTAMETGTTYSGSLTDGVRGLWDRYTACSINEQGTENFYSFTAGYSAYYTFSATRTSGTPDFFVMRELDNTGENLISDGGGYFASGKKDVLLYAGETCYLVADKQSTEGIASYEISVSFDPEKIVGDSIELGRTYSGVLGTSGIWEDYRGCVYKHLPGQEAVYSFTAPDDGIYTFSSLSLTPIFLMDKPSNTGTNLLSGNIIYDSYIKLSAGEKVYLIADNPSSTDSARYSFVVRCGKKMSLKTIYNDILASGAGNWGSYPGCSAAEPGKEYIYHFTAPSSGQYNFTGETVSGNPDFFLMDDADNTGVNLISGGCWDSGEQPLHLNEGETVYLIVDNSSSSAEAKYSVSVNIGTLDVMPMALGETYSGTLGTRGIWNTYTDYRCGALYGQENFYSFTASYPGNYQFSASAVWGDPGFFLMDDWRNTGTNLAGGCWDSGDKELDLESGQTVYVTVDNNDETDAGYTVSVKIKKLDSSCLTPMVLNTNYSETLSTGSGIWTGYTSVTSTYPGKEALYSFTPPETDIYSFKTTVTKGSPGFFLMKELRNTSDNLLDGPCFGSTDIFLVGGQTVYLIADNSSINQEAGFTVSVKLTPTPMVLNTDYSETLSTGSGIWTGYTSVASTYPGKEAFYSFTATETGGYRFKGTETSGDPDFFLMNGPDNTSKNLLGHLWGEGIADIPMSAGQTVYLIVDNDYSTKEASFTVSVKKQILGGAMELDRNYDGTIGTVGMWDKYTSGNAVPGQEAFYTFTPSCSGTFEFTGSELSGNPDFFLASEQSNTSGLLGFWYSGSKEFSLTKGRTYFLMIDNCSSSEDAAYRVSVKLKKLTPIPMVLNTNYSETLSTGSGIWSSYPSASGSFQGREMVYSFTAGHSGYYRFTGNDIRNYPEFFIMTTPGNTGQNLITNTSYRYMDHGSVDIPMTAGQTVYLIVDNYYSNNDAAYSVSVSQVAQVAPISMSLGTNYTNTIPAGTGLWLNYPSVTGTYKNFSGREVVYSFTAGHSGYYRFTGKDIRNCPDFFIMTTPDNTGQNLITTISSRYMDHGSVDIRMTAGQTVYLIVDNYYSDKDAEYFVSVIQAIDNLMEMFLDTWYSNTVRNKNNPKKYGSCGWTETGGEHYYLFTAPSAGTYHFTGISENGDPDFFLMDGASNTSTNFTYWNSGTMDFHLESWKTVYLIVDNYYSVSQSDYKVRVTKISTKSLQIPGTADSEEKETFKEEDLDGPGSYTVYPNPAKNELFVQLKNLPVSRVDIINAAGQVLKTSKSASDIIRFDISGFTKGVYFVVIYTEDKNKYTEEVIVM